MNPLTKYQVDCSKPNSKSIESMPLSEAEFLQTINADDEEIRDIQKLHQPAGCIVVKSDKFNEICANGIVNGIVINDTCGT